MTRQEVKDHLGPRMKKSRRAKGITVVELAKQVGVLPDALYKIECGSRTPSLLLLIKIATVIEQEINYLVGIHDSEAI